MIDLTIFLLKYAFIGFIYLFMLWLILLISKDLRVKPAQMVTKQTKYPKKKAGLVLEEGPGIFSPKHFSIGNETTIGRSPRNKIKIDDEAASYFHAKISADNGNFLLEDMGSTNGTFVNGEMVKEPLALQSGFQVTIGRSKFLFTEK